MTFGRAFVWGLALTFAMTVIVGMVGFLGGVTIALPGFIELSSSADGVPRTELQLNPLVPLLLAVALATVLWLVGRATRRRT